MNRKILSSAVLVLAVFALMGVTAMAEDAVKIFTDADVTAVLYEHEFEGKIAAVLPRCPLIRHTFDLGDVGGFETIYKEY